MERNTTNSVIPNDVLYGKRTKNLRIIEMILCIICLALAIYFWTAVHVLNAAIMILFATSFGFFIITIMDIIAGIKNRQYTSPAWIVLAFLGSFMFFLCFGFMLFQAFWAFIAIGVVNLITAVVFLIDAILILIQLLKLYRPEKVHPEPSENIEEALEEQIIQEPVEEVPAQMRTYSPRTAALPKKTQSGSNFPITSYGGTFPMGGRDAAPLPTPGNLTGLDPAISSQNSALKKPVRERPSEVLSSVSDGSPRRNELSLEGQNELYPIIDEEIIEKKVYTPIESMRAETYEEYTETEPPSTARDVPSCIRADFFYEKRRTCPVEVRVNMKPEYAQTEIGTPCYFDEIPGRVVGPYEEAAGEPNIPPMCNKCCSERRHHLEMLARNAQTQGCKCCCTQRNMAAREQVTPFVTHHYDQSPCICGYTHYQASTVIKGAVRQYPQDTVEEQQRMIRNQLEQMRDSYRHHVCSCHDQPEREPTVHSTTYDDHGLPLASMVNSPDTSFVDFQESQQHGGPGAHREQDSNRSLRQHGGPGAHREQDSNRSLRLKSQDVISTPTGYSTPQKFKSPEHPRTIDETPDFERTPDPSMRSETTKRVTIGTLDIKGSFLDSGDKDEYQRLARQWSLQETPPSNQEIRFRNMQGSSTSQGSRNRRNTLDSQACDTQSILNQGQHNKTLPTKEQGKYETEDDKVSFDLNSHPGSLANSDRRKSILSSDSTSKRRESIISNKSGQYRYRNGKQEKSPLPKTRKESEAFSVSESADMAPTKPASKNFSSGKPAESSHNNSIDSGRKPTIWNVMKEVGRKETFDTTATLNSFPFEGDVSTEGEQSQGHDSVETSTQSEISRDRKDEQDEINMEDEKYYSATSKQTWASEAQQIDEPIVQSTYVAPLTSRRTSTTSGDPYKKSDRSSTRDNESIRVDISLVREPSSRKQDPLAFRPCLCPGSPSYTRLDETEEERFSSTPNRKYADDQSVRTETEVRSYELRFPRSTGENARSSVPSQKRARSEIIEENKVYESSVPSSVAPMSYCRTNNTFDGTQERSEAALSRDNDSTRASPSLGRDLSSRKEESMVCTPCWCPERPLYPGPDTTETKRISSTRTYTTFDGRSERSKETLPRDNYSIRVDTSLAQKQEPLAPILCLCPKGPSYPTPTSNRKYQSNQSVRTETHDSSTLPSWVDVKNKEPSIVSQSLHYSEQKADETSETSSYMLNLKTYTTSDASHMRNDGTLSRDNDSIRSSPLSKELSSQKQRTSVHDDSRTFQRPTDVSVKSNEKSFTHERDPLASRTCCFCPEIPSYPPAAEDKSSKEGNDLISRSPSRRPTVESSRSSVVRQRRPTFETIEEQMEEKSTEEEIQKNPVVLPRMVHPIEEQRKREGISVSSSEDFRSHLPFGPTQDMVMIKELSCKCICKCVCTNTSNSGMKETQEFRRRANSYPCSRKYNVPPLTEQPYHPKDDFKLPDRAFQICQNLDTERRCNTLDNRHGTSTISCRNPRCTKESVFTKFERTCTIPEDRRTSLRRELFPYTFDGAMCQPQRTYVDREPLRSQARKRSSECLPECPSCPKRKEREAREAKIRSGMQEHEIPYYEECSSTSKRSTVKRPFPSDRR